MSKVSRIGVVLLLATLCYGCARGHTKVSRIGLLSTGDLGGLCIPKTIDGPILTGIDRGMTWWYSGQFLSLAVRDALEGTPFDTIIDAEVTATTGWCIWNNFIEVKGKGISSKSLVGMEAADGE